MGYDLFENIQRAMELILRQEKEMKRLMGPVVSLPEQSQQSWIRQEKEMKRLMGPVVSLPEQSQQSWIRQEKEMKRLMGPILRQHEEMARLANPLGLVGDLQRKIKTSPPHQDTGGHSAVRSHLIAPKQSESIYTKSSEFEPPCPRDEHGEEDTRTDIQSVAKAKLEESGNIITLLEQVDPRLVVLYTGAWDAFRGDNPDRARHILISLRTLWHDLLKQLAPNDHVVIWIPQVAWIPLGINQKNLLHGKEPTWEARIRYIFPEFNNGRIKSLKHKPRVLVELIKFLNKVHESETGLKDQDLREILLESDSWLISILDRAVR